MIKTNAIRLLSGAKIPFETVEYEVDENNLAGTEVAKKVGIPVEQVFKTLVAKGEKHGVCVFCIPAAKELDLKKAAKLVGEKKIEMLHVKDLLATTGYIRGGCSPIGMKKKFPTFMHESILNYDMVAVSAGVRGCQVNLAPSDLVKFVGAKTADIIL
ncbi:MAG: Cys-tRNA(Pro) deacylase [bacterium]|nr:Cys-tRNA(Pro) deacylase [bacterium]